MKKFKYDYNNKLFLIHFAIFLFIFFDRLFFKDSMPLIISVLSLIIEILMFFYTFIVIRAQGIKINNKNNIIIVNSLRIKKLCINDVKYVELKQIPKETKSKLFISLLYRTENIISEPAFVCNQGKVYGIYFHLNDGTIYESIFGWLYREKEKTVNKVEKKLLDFIDDINVLCKEN